MLLHRVPSRSSRTHLFHGTRVVPEQVQGKHTLVGYGALDDVVEPSFPHLGDRIPRHARCPFFSALGSASHARVSSHRRRQGPPSTRQVRRHRRRLSSCDVAIVGGTARPLESPLDLTRPIWGLNTPPHGRMGWPRPIGEDTPIGGRCMALREEQTDRRRRWDTQRCKKRMEASGIAVVRGRGTDGRSEVFSIVERRRRHARRPWNG